MLGWGEDDDDDVVERPSYFRDDESWFDGVDEELWKTMLDNAKNAGAGAARRHSSALKRPRARPAGHLTAYAHKYAAPDKLPEPARPYDESPACGNFGTPPPQHAGAGVAPATTDMVPRRDRDDGAPTAARKHVGPRDGALPLAKRIRTPPGLITELSQDYKVKDARGFLGYDSCCMPCAPEHAVPGMKLSSHYVINGIYRCALKLERSGPRRRFCRKCRSHLTDAELLERAARVFGALASDLAPERRAPGAPRARATRPCRNPIPCLTCSRPLRQSTTKKLASKNSTCSSWVRACVRPFQLACNVHLRFARRLSRERPAARDRA